MTKLSENIENLAVGLNDAQKEAVLNPCDYCTKIVAGAGTGKTKIISKRFTKLVYELLENGVESPQTKILVITFTDKAAAEMKERILKELEENQLSSKNLLNDDLWISTFHSFCMRILKKYSVEAGLSPSFKMADEKELKNLYDNLIKQIKYGEVGFIENVQEILEDSGVCLDDLSVDCISSLSKIDDLENLFEDIYLVIKKIKSLGLSPKEFLDKTLEATKQYSKVIESIPFKFESKDDYAFAWKEHLREYIDDYCVFDTKTFDEISGTKTILDKFGKRKAIEYGFAQGFPENIKVLEKEEVKLTKIICAIYALYQADLGKSDVADFDDLINKTIQIFKENESIRDYYQEYFKHIIVDEFQDTNGAQLELIELLLNEKCANLTYVGDRKQSIYGFRFAQMENLEVLFENVKSRYNKDYDPISLSINYRSTPDVLNAVNFVTENELKLEGENLCANPFKEFSPTPLDICVTTIDGFENSFEQKFSEASYIASEIKRLKDRDDSDFKDFAVLVKSHAQADIIEKELKKHNIPSMKKVNTGFFQESVIKNVIAAFRLIKNINDEQAFLRLLTVVMNSSEIYRFKKLVDEKLLEQIEFEQLRRLNLVQKFLLLSGEADFENSYSKKAIDVVNKIRKSKNSMSLMQIFESIKTNLMLYNASSDFEMVQISNNLKILEMIIDDFSQNVSYVSVSSLLDYIENASNDRSFELPSIYSQDVNAVQILTIHASKGLEFKYVFVLSISSAAKNPEKSNIIFDLQYGNRPGFGLIINKFKGKDTSKSVLYKYIWKNPRDINEDLRLFYVAVSRAKNYLNVLSFAPYKSVKPASYIEDLQNYLVNF